MSGPPFPVPRGMEWDPIRRRFFKPEPGSAKAAVANNEGRPRLSKHAKRKERLLKEQKGNAAEDDGQESLDQARFAISSPRLGWHALRSNAAPRMHASRSSKYDIAAQHLAQAKVAQVARLGNLDLLRYNVCANNLSSSVALGSLLFFNISREGPIQFIDSAEDADPEQSPLAAGEGQVPVSAFDIYHLNYPWTSKSRAFQQQTTSRSRTIEQHNVTLNSIFSQTRAGASKTRLFCLEDDCLAYFSTPLTVDVVQLNTCATSPQTGRQMKVNRLFRFSLPSKQDEEGFTTISMKRFARKQIHSNGALALCIGIGRRAIVIRANMINDGGGASRVGTMYRSQTKCQSDVLCHDIQEHGEVVLLGMRSGKVATIELSPLDIDDGDSIMDLADGRADSSSDVKMTEIKIDKGRCLPFECQGAITNLKFISQDEFIIATNRQEIHRAMLREQAEQPPLQAWRTSYKGHVNQWTLDTLMCVDKDHRIFALEGQDNHVRIWSFDRPLPIFSSEVSLGALLAGRRVANRTHGAPSTEPSIVGLCFCQRKDVRLTEERQNVAFLPRGVPALAVALSDGTLVFIE